MADTPRCDFVPIRMWIGEGDRCENPAQVKVLRSHGAGINPVYKDRCIAHAIGALGPAIAAYWDPDREEWLSTD